MTQVYDIQIVRGDDTPQYRLVVTGDSGAPVNLTGYTAAARIGSRSIATVATGVVDTTDAATGILLLSYTDTETAKLVADEQYTHQVRITAAAGRSPITILRGTVRVVRSLFQA